MASLISKDTSGALAAPLGAMEVTSKRTRTFKTWRLPDTGDGRRHFRIGGSIGRIHYRADPFSTTEEFKEIDLEIQPTPAQEWDYAMEENGYQLRIWENRTVAGQNLRCVGQFRRAGHWIGIAPLALAYVNDAGQRQLIATPAAAVTARIDNNAYRVTWTDLFGPGIHFRFNLRSDEFFKTVIIDHKSDLPAPTIGLMGIRLTIVLAVTWDSTTRAANGFAAGHDPVNPPTAPPTGATDEALADPPVFSFLDTDDRALWWIWRPKAWDSFAPNAHKVDMTWRLERRGEFVVAALMVTGTALNNPQAVYPVYIDTVIGEEVVGAILDDAYEYDMPPAYTGAEANWVGTIGIIADYTRWGGFRFQTVPIPDGVTIDSASLSGYVGGLDSPNGALMRAEEGDAAAFVEGYGANISGRTVTAASVAWPGIDIGVNQYQTTPDLAAVIQEVVDTSWAENYDLVITITAVAGSDIDIQAFDQAGVDFSAKFNAEYSAVAAAIHSRAQIIG